MSGATYRIETEYDPHVGMWFSKIRRLTDDMPMDSTFGNTASESQQKAREWVRRETADRDERHTVYVDDFGQDAEAHSVKA